MRNSISTIVVYLATYLAFIGHATALAKSGYRPLLTDKDKEHFGREVKAKYGLMLVGLGGGPGIGPNGIKHVSFTFSTKYPRPIAEARKLCVELTEDLLRRIRKDQAKRGEIPATVAAIELSIDFNNLWGEARTSKRRANDVTHAYVHEGYIMYGDYEEGEQRTSEERIEAVRVEKYEDALRIVSMDEEKKQ